MDSAKVITHDGQGVLRFSLVLTDMNPAAQIWALQPFEGKESPLFVRFRAVRQPSYSDGDRNRVFVG